MATSVAGKFVFGQKDVAAAGTAVQLDAGGYKLSALTIIAHADNAGQIFYGGSDVDSSTQKGLDAGESITIALPERTPRGPGFDIGSIYVDAGTNDDGVDFIGVLA